MSVFLMGAVGFVGWKWLLPDHSKAETQLEKISASADKQHDLSVVGQDQSIQLALDHLKKRIDQQQHQIQQQEHTINVLSKTLVETNQAKWMDAQSQHSDTLQQQKAHSEYQLESLETAVLTEAIDNQWSQQAVSHIEEAVQNVLPEDIELAQLDCQTTLCKVELSHQQAEDIGEHVDQLLFQLGWQTTSYMQTSDEQDGSTYSVIYLSREGYELPGA